MAPAIYLTLAAMLGTTTVVLTEQMLSDAYIAAHDTVVGIERVRDAETEKAAQALYRLEGGHGSLQVNQAVSRGYITKDYLTRPTVGPVVPLEDLKAASQDQ